MSNYQSPKPLVILAVAFLVLFCLLAFGTWMCSEAKAQDAAVEPGMNFIPIDDYSGGINHSTPRGQLAPNEYLKLTNLLLLGNKLESRRGQIQLGEAMSSNPLEFMDVFATKAGATYLLASDGETLWYRTGITQTANALEIGRSNRGIVDTWDTVVGGDSIAVQKWRTIFGTAEGATITIDGTDYIVDKVILDTLLWLTTSAGTLTDKSFNLDYASVDVRFGVPMTTAYWIYSSTGRFTFTNPSDFDIVDSLTGQRYTYTAVRRKCGPWLEWTSASVTTDYSGKFLRIVTNPKSAGGSVDPVTGTHPIYTSYPIRNSGSGKLTTWATAFMPDSTTTQYFTIEELELDTTSITVVNVDSIRLLVADSTGFTCGLGGGFGQAYSALYLKVCDGTFDSSDFITGDYFFYPTFDSSYDVADADLPVAAYGVFPVAGGFVDPGGCVYVAASGQWIVPRDDPAAYYIPDTNDVPVTLYRMKKSGSGNVASNYTWAAPLDNRVFWSEADDPTFVKYSEPHDPATQDGGLYMFTAEGDAPVAGLLQGEVLRVYCENSRHIITSADGYLYTTQQLSFGVGCSAPKTLREYNGIHYYLHRTGVYADDGGRAELVSDKVSSWFTDSIPSSSYRDAAAEIYDRKYWISFPLESGGRKTLVYDLVVEAWTDLDNLAFTATATYGGRDTTRFMFSDPDSGAVLAYYGNLDRDDSITAVIQTDYIDAGDIENDKTWRLAIIGWDNATGSTLSLSTYLNHSTTAASSYSFAGSSFGSKRVNPPSLLGRNISLKLTISGAAEYKHRLMKVGYEGKDLAN